MTKRKVKKVPLMQFLEMLCWDADCMANDGILCLSNIQGCEIDFSDDEAEIFIKEFENELDQVQSSAEQYVQDIRDLMSAYATKYPDKVPADLQDYIQKSEQSRKDAVGALFG